MNSNDSISDTTQTSAVLQALDKVTSLLFELKIDIGGRLDSLAERNLDLQTAVDKINTRLDGMNAVPVKQDQLVVTPQQKIRDGRLVAQIRTLRTEIFRLTEENGELRKRSKNSRRTFEPRPTLPTEHLESVRSEKSSNEDFLAEAQGAEVKKKVREFCLDSNPSHSIKGIPDPQLELVSDKAENSDANSVKTSKGGKGQTGSKFDFLGIKQPNDFKLSLQVPSFFEAHSPEPFPNNPNEFFEMKRHYSTILGEKPEAIWPRLGPKPEFSDSNSEESRVSGSKCRPAKTVKDFSDFQNLLRELKHSLNASIYSSFNNDIEENVQLLTSILERYKGLDDRIESAYQNVKAKRREIRGSANQSVSGSLSGASNQPSPANAVQLEKLRTARKRLGDLRLASNLNSYEAKLVKIQSNPSDLESFLYTIKAELAKRELTFGELQQNACMMA